jgi:predicted RecA/RadA family phage recombinase
MGTKFRQKGDVLDHVAGGAIAADDVVVMGDTIGIAEVDLATGETGAVAVEGVFEVPKTAGTAWAQGDSIDWDASAGEFHKGITPAAGDVAACGIAAKAAASGDTTAWLKLTPGTGTGS